jgi:hypothetical protein
LVFGAGRSNMRQVLSYCGYRCDRCPAYRENLKSPEGRRKVSEAWAKYYDYRVEPAQVDCDGCPEASEAPNPNCKIRPCAIEKGLPNCAHCSDFICEKLMKQMDAIKPIAERNAQTMPPEDYERYIRPYESEERLRKLQEGL